MVAASWGPSRNRKNSTYSITPSAIRNRAVPWPMLSTRVATKPETCDSARVNRGEIAQIGRLEHPHHEIRQARVCTLQQCSRIKLAGADALVEPIGLLGQSTEHQ